MLLIVSCQKSKPGPAPPLAQMLNVGRLVYTYADACAWAEDIADGLAYLHSYNPQIIHRDVKLDNVLLRRVPPLSGP